jgi:hypothetical protein
MGSSRGPYQAEFPAGTVVRIADRATLERFVATWQRHHPLSTDQLAYAGWEARVQEVSFYHGGDELYSLETVPGLWHEQCLVALRSPGAA